MEIAPVALASGKLGPVFSALDGCLKCHRERAKINGLAQPVRVELQSTLDDVEKAFDAYMQGIADRDGSALNGGEPSA